MKFKTKFGNAVIGTIDWLLIIGWCVSFAIMAVVALVALLSGDFMGMMMVFGITILMFILFSVSTGMWFLVGNILDAVRELKGGTLTK